MTARNTIAAIKRGREDWKKRDFINPYKSPSLRTAWQKGLSQAAADHRADLRRASRRTDADLYAEGRGA